MKKNNKKPTFSFGEVIVISLVSSLVMSLSTGYVVFRSENNGCSKVASSKPLQEFIKTYNNVLDNYYEEVDEKTLIDAAINGMLSKLGDQYTTYLDETNTSILTDSLAGTYQGIGVEVTTTDQFEIKIMNVFDKSPAKVAGLEVGDVIVKVNDIDLVGKTAQDAVDIIQSTDDITITVLRNGEELSFDLSKSSLYVPVITTEIYEENNHKIGYLSISKFSDTVEDQFVDEFNKLKSESIDSLLLDLRNNTGGYLKGATKIASVFLEKGKVIYSLESKLSKETTKDETEESQDIKVYILINSGTASASEVLTAALKESYGATVIGAKSFGKGKVQKTSNLSDGTMYKYTTAKWLTPNGTCVDGVGITPDIEVEQSENYIEMPTFENDLQLSSAISEISK